MAKEIVVYADRVAKCSSPPTLIPSGGASFIVQFILKNRHEIYKYPAYIGFPFPLEIHNKHIRSIVFMAHIDPYSKGDIVHTGPDGTVIWTFDHTPASLKSSFTEATISEATAPRMELNAGQRITNFSYSINKDRYSDVLNNGIGLTGNFTYSTTGHLTIESIVIYSKYFGYGAVTPANQRPRLVITYDDLIPTVRQPAPVNSYVDERRTARFSWLFYVEEYASIDKITQKSATWQWRIKNGAISGEKAIGESQFVEIPPSTFPANSSLEWRVNVVSIDNVSSGYTQWFAFTTIDAASAATAIRPSGLYLDKLQPITFTWRHATPTGSVQSKAELQIKYGSSAWQALATITGIAQEFVQPANTMTSGLMTWRVRTYNAQNLAGDWSAELSNTIIASPGKPNINSIREDKSRPRISWQCGEQEMYELYIESNNQIIYSSGIVLDSVREHYVKKYLHNGQYKVFIRAKNIFDMWSEWSEFIFNINALKPQVPDMFITPIINGVYVAINNPNANNTYYLHRISGGRDILIAPLGGGYSYTDYRSAGEAHYYIRAIDSDDNFADSLPNKAIADLQGAVLASALYPQELIAVNIGANAPATRSYELDMPGRFVQYEGRSNPVAEYSDGQNKKRSLTFTAYTDEDLYRLENLVKSKETLLLRDKSGLCEYVATLGLKCEDEYARFKTFSITVITVDVNEEDYAIA